MKYKLVVFFFYFLGSFFCVAQEKFDHQWVVGYPPEGDPGSLFGAYLMDFNDDTLKLIHVPQASLVTLSSTASICDKDGKLLLYSNGCQIHNGNFQLIEGCENVNPGPLWDNYCTYPNAEDYPTVQSQVILPIPEQENQYIYLTHRHEVSAKYNWSQTNWYTEFYHCNIIDMSLSDGKGKSISSFDIQYPDIVKGWNLAACKHANGKDWWIINFSFNTQKFYRLLLTKDGISGPWEQDGGPPRDSTSSVGQAVFSPDGTKYACIYSSAGKAWIMDFDRETGLLSNLKIIKHDTYKDLDGRGISFSPNSRYLYISSEYYLDQFDTDSSNIQKSKILVGANDGYSLPGWPYYISFCDQQLGPDGKIYIGQYVGGCRQWSIINKPNEKGLVCDFKQHSLTFPVYSTPNVPIQPNFRLGPDSTLSVLNIPINTVQMKSWFNWATKTIKCWLQHMQNNKSTYTLTVSDITGRTLIMQKISESKYQEDITLDGSYLAPGVYIVNLLEKGNVVAVDKVMVY